MKKLGILLLILIVVAAMAGTGSAATPVTGITINRQNVSLTNEARDVMLYALFTPNDATNKVVSWEVSKEGIIKDIIPMTVGAQVQYITALRDGEVTITATTQDGGHKATCKIVVTGVKPSITLLRSSISVTYRESFFLTAVVSPAGEEIEWSVVSGSNLLAHVASDGSTASFHVLGQTGIATVSARLKNTPSISATCRVEIVPEEEDNSPIDAGCSTGAATASMFLLAIPALTLIFRKRKSK